MQRRNFIIDELHPDCPIRNIIYRITDKWSLLTLYTLSTHDSMRFKQLQKAIPGISQKMLTATLRTLEEDGYVTRTAYAEVPPRVEYRLTERANSLLPHIQSLITWAISHFADIIKSRQNFHEKKVE